MTRGTDVNLAFVFTTPPKVADPQPGTRSAPELDRYERRRREREGLLPTYRAPEPGSPDPREAIAGLADVLGRDGAALSASETRRRNLANADHLGILNAIWAAEIRSARNCLAQQQAILIMSGIERFPTRSTSDRRALRSRPGGR